LIEEAMVKPTGWGGWGWKGLTVCLCLAALLGCTREQKGSMMAQGDTMQMKKVIDGRKELMRNNSGHFKDLRQKAKDGQMAPIAVNAQTIAINARHIPALFPAGSLGTPEIESRAKADIWHDWNGFTAAAKQLEDAAADLAKLTRDADKMAVSSAQVDAAIKAIGGACKNCHDKFRAAKKKM
jgi:cytochrome c556